MVDTTGPSAPSLSPSGPARNPHHNRPAAHHNPQAGKSGSFQAQATSTDNDSGLLKVNFPSPTGFSSGGGDSNSSPYQTTYNWSGAVAASGSQTTTAYNNANLSNSNTFTITPDTTAPTGGALTVNGTNATGAGSTSYNSSGSSTIGTISDYTDSGSGLTSSVLTRQSATLGSSNGIAAGSCGSFGSATTISSRATPIAQALAGPTCYLYTLTGLDNVGNTVTITTTVMVDTTGPSAPSLSLSGATGNTYINGTTAYINAQAGKSGSFQAQATSTDNDSGLLKVNFPSPTGFSSGGGDSNSSPYQTTYNWSGAVAASGSQTTTAYNNANLTNTNTFTITPDTTAPTGGALTVNGTNATGPGSPSYNSSGSWTIGAISDYTDSGSGLTSSVLTRQSATLGSSNGIAAGSCGSFGSATTIPGRATPIAQALTGPTCYLYTLTGLDNVGNTVTITTTVMVDTTGPSAPSLSLSGATGNTYINGTTAYINAQAGKSGSFQAQATSTDNDSGLLKVNFPSPTGFSSGGGDSNSSPYQTTYNWSGAVAASGSQTTTAYNNANLTNSNTFTITPDTTAPTGGALTVNGTNATGAGSTSYNSSGSSTIGTISDYTDSGSGLTSSVLTRQSATLGSSNGIAAGSCGSFGSATTIPGRATPIAQALTGPTCYLYTLTGLDNVGNTVTITTTVMVDTTGPSAPSLSLSSATGNTYINGTTAYINAQAGKSGSFQAAATSTDNDSGLLKVNFPSPTGFSSGGGDSNSSPYQTTYNWSGAVAASGSQTTTAYNNANLTNSNTFTITPD